MSPPIQTVALSGATGSLGEHLLAALLGAGLTVTVLARASRTHSFPPTVRVATVDYDDPRSLEEALRGQDAVVSAVGYAGFASQEALVDAAVAAGVRRIIPSEFGADPDVAPARALPVFAGKVRVAEYVRERTRGTGTTYTLVANGLFSEWTLDRGFGVDVEGRRVELFDGGDVVATQTPLGLVARGVVAILRRPAETADRVVRLHGAGLTQRRLLGIVQRVVGSEGWEVSHVDTVGREKLGYEKMESEAGDPMGWALPFLQAAVWAKRFGGDFSENNDNELLGLKELTEAEIEEILRGTVQSGKASA